MAKINLGRVRPIVDTALDASSNNPISNAAVTRALEEHKVPGFDDMRQIADSEASLKKAVSTINEILENFGVPRAPNTTTYTNTAVKTYGFREVCAGKHSDGRDILVAGGTSKNGMIYSFDGIAWEQALVDNAGITSPLNTGDFEDPIFCEELNTFVASGSTGVYYSVDGVVWHQTLVGQGGEISLWRIPVGGITRTVFLVGAMVSYDGKGWSGGGTYGGKALTHNISSNGVVIPASDSSTGFRVVIPSAKMLIWCDDPFESIPTWTAVTMDSSFPEHTSAYDTLSAGTLKDGSPVIFAAPTSSTAKSPILFSRNGKSFAPSGTIGRQWETPLVINGTNKVIAGTMAGGTGDYLYVTENFSGMSTSWAHVNKGANGGSLTKCGYYTPKVVVGKTGIKYYVTTGYRFDSGIIVALESDITKWYRLDYSQSKYEFGQFRCPTQFKDLVVFPGSNNNGIKYVKLADFEAAVEIAMNKEATPDVEKIGDTWTEEDIVRTVNALVDEVNSIDGSVVVGSGLAKIGSSWTEAELVGVVNGLVDVVNALKNIAG